MVFHLVFEKLSPTVSLPVQSILSQLLMGGVCIYGAVSISNNECNPAVAIWEVLPFIISAIGCFFGVAIESYLVFIGKPFELDSFPTLMNIRAGNVILVYASKLVFILTLCLGAAAPAGVVETYAIYAAILYTMFAYPLMVLNMPQYTINVSKIVLVVRMLVAMIAGPTYGGLANNFVLMISECIPIYCVVNVDHMTALGSTCLHFYSLFEYVLTLLAVKLAQNACEDQCYGQEYEKEVSFPFIFFAATAVVGIVIANILKKNGVPAVEMRDENTIV
jgi:hypothetical protein